MNFISTNLNKIVILFLLCGLTSVAVPAQATRQEEKPTLIVNAEPEKMPVAGFTNLYCAGYVQTAPVDTSREIVGAYEEASRHVYAEGNVLIVNTGAGSVRIGDEFQVIRPRGRVETRWTDKDNLGYLVEEVGIVEVIAVNAETSFVRVKKSCSALLLGDLLQPLPRRESPLYRDRPALNLFAAPSGKASGRIFMGRDGNEMLAREQIVYIDLGAEDNVQIGDYLTIYRPLGTGGLFEKVEDESVSARDEGFQSDEYRGGKFSNQAARKKGELARGKVVTTENAKSRRPEGLRRILGEMIVLNVKEKTATAVIVRTASEIHTGDRVELQ